MQVLTIDPVWEPLLDSLENVENRILWDKLFDDKSMAAKSTFGSGGGVHWTTYVPGKKGGRNAHPRAGERWCSTEKGIQIYEQNWNPDTNCSIYSFYHQLEMKLNLPPLPEGPDNYTQGQLQTHRQAVEGQLLWGMRQFEQILQREAPHMVTWWNNRCNIVEANLTMRKGGRLTYKKFNP